MKLYEIDSMIEDAISQMLDFETGEIVDSEAYEWFNELKIARENKIEGIILYHKSLNAEAAALKAEEAVLAERRRVIENRAASLKRFAEKALGGEKFETARCKVGYRKSARLVVDDENVLAGYAQYWKQPSPVLDKAGLKKAISGGAEVNGAHIEECRNMSIK